MKIKNTKAAKCASTKRATKLLILKIGEGISAGEVFICENVVSDNYY